MNIVKLKKWQKSLGGKNFATVVWSQALCKMHCEMITKLYNTSSLKLISVKQVGKQTLSFFTQAKRITYF